jgi:molecular chaperone DnaJ
MEDPYKILNVSKDASPEDVKKAFRKLAIENHPDKHQGCKDKETIFKSINQAYSVLSDPKKRQQYDQFGTLDENGGPPPEFNYILRNMFGGGMGGFPGMGGGMPGGFQFVFTDHGGGVGGGGGIPGMPDDIFAQMFGGMGGGGGKKQQAPKYDIVNVGVDINDIYYGNNKKVEFEMLELCSACQGSGASDPSQVINCVTCKGAGELIQQIGPFVNKVRCPSCAGNGSVIKKNCNTCKGQKTVYNKKAFDLRLPKGIPNNHEVRMAGRGSYNPQTKSNKDMIFKFKHEIQNPYKLDDDMNVIMTVPITIEELVAGFVKNIKIYKEDMTITSDRYFNPIKPVVVKDKGIIDMRVNETTDLHLKFEVEFIDSEKLSKYKDIFHKIFKKVNVEDNENVINIHSVEN